MNQEPESREDIQDDEVIARAMKGSLILIATVAVLLLVGWLGWQWYGQQPEEESITEVELPKQRELVKQEIPLIPLSDITSESGVDWSHVSGMEGEKLLPETMGGGVAVFDYDHDGDLDLLFVGGESWPWAKQRVANPRSLCLYQNDGDAHFRDVTEQAGLNQNFYAMGPVIGDYDNDGWQDLLVTAVGKDRLYHNNQGVFEDVTQASGIEGDGWSSGATWIDYDRDGLLDLFICDYVIWQRELDLSLGFSLTGVGRAYGQPTSFTGTHSRLYHNDGDGRFSDVSADMGIEIENPNTGVPVGKGLGVAAIDVNEDGWQDLIVANDTVQNFLFLNIEGTFFEESAIQMGLAFDRTGNATGAMGVDCGFFRNDGSLAIAIGNFANEQSSLYVSRGPEIPFFDAAMASGLGPMSRLNLTFGLFFADLDLDSRLDMVCANGHLEAEIAKVQSTQQYAQPPQFFWNAGKGGSSELVALGAEQVGEAALTRMVGRGAAYGDLDSDGDVDIVLVENSGSPRILRNDQQIGNHWVRVRLEGAAGSGTNAYGAVVELRSNEVSQRRVISATRSYLSQCETTLTFGLGATEEIQELSVLWPSGRRETFDIVCDSEHLLREGEGTQATQKLTEAVTN